MTNSTRIQTEGVFFEMLQTSGLYHDSKDIVDLVLTESPSAVLSAVSRLPRRKKAIQAFVKRYTALPGSELTVHTPSDWNPTIDWGSTVKDPGAQRLLSHIHSTWMSLARTHIPDVPDSWSTLLRLPHPFFVPGGRFREAYYWDGYWIMLGLLRSGMTTSAKELILNFLSLINRFGFVPNGNRTYYTDRSQPPMLTLMVKLYLDMTSDEEILALALPFLRQEHTFWLNHRTCKESGLFHYDSAESAPRPESFPHDKALNLKSCRAVRAAAESGWDFSSRWTGTKPPEKVLQNLMTTSVLPVDLNSILIATERLLAEFHRRLGYHFQAAQLDQLSHYHAVSVEKHLFDKVQGQYFDAVVQGTSITRSSRPYLSVAFAMWLRPFPPSVDGDARVRRVWEALGRAGFAKHQGGVPVSLVNSGEQWDLPNAWPPVVHALIMGLAQVSLLENAANEVAQRWLRGSFDVFCHSKTIYEKRNVLHNGAGGGGEYDVQVGFGWSNGVLLDLLRRYPNTTLTCDS